MAHGFDFGIGFQKSTLRLMLEDEHFCNLAAGRLKREFFDTPAMGWLYDVTQRHWKAYARPPSSIVIEESMRALDPMVHQAYLPEIDSIIRMTVLESEFIGRELLEFVRRNLFVEGFHLAKGLYNEGKADASYDYMAQRMDEIHAVTLVPPDRSFYFNQLDDRMTSRHAKDLASDSHTFPTGIPMLDRILDGGLSKGELGTWIAYPKIGKSMMLLWLAFYAIRAIRAKVLWFVLEGSREMVETRFDAAFANAYYSLLKRGTLDATKHRLLSEEFRDLQGLLVVRGYTTDEKTWNVTVLDLMAEIRELKGRFGFSPDMICVDYAGLMQARTDGLSSYEVGKEVYRDLKRMASMGYAIWTAHQARRPSVDVDEEEHILKYSEMSDSIEPVRVCDFIGSLNMTAAERGKNRIRLYGDIYRDNEAGRLIRVNTDFPRSRIVASIVQEPDAEEADFDAATGP